MKNNILSCECNTILNHTGIYFFAKGKLMLHLQYDFENSDNCNTAGSTLRYYRIHKGYTTRELANLVGVVPATITLYENDKNPIKYKTAVLLPCDPVLKRVASSESPTQQMHRSHSIFLILQVPTGHNREEAPRYQNAQ